MRTPFITVVRNEDRFLLRSPLIPELFIEGSGPAQSIERLRKALEVVLKDYEHRDQKIASPSAIASTSDPLQPADLEMKQAGRLFIEVLPESNNRYLMTSPVFPELFVEGRGMHQAVARLSHALKVLLKHYLKAEQPILMS